MLLPFRKQEGYSCSIYSTSCAFQERYAGYDLCKAICCFEDVSTDKIINIYKENYKDEHFIRVLEGKNLPNVKAVNGSNFLELTGRFDPESNYIKLFSAQDNLGKGAALQAIQSFNIMFGLDEAEGLGTLVRGV